MLRTSVTENTVQRLLFYDPKYEELMLLTKTVKAISLRSGLETDVLINL